MTAPERVPTELWRLAQLMEAEPANAPKPDLYDRLVAQEGRDRAGELWLAACSESDHETACLIAENELRQGIKGALADLGAALAGLRQLRGGEAWHPDYAESQDGTDIEAFLGQARLLLRAAARLVPEPTTEPAGGPVLDANGDRVEVPPHIVAGPSFRLFMAGRVPAGCGHYIAASEARAGIDRCEHCMMGQD